MANLFISRWTIDPARRDDFLAVFNRLYEAAKDLLAQQTTLTYYGWGRNPNEFVAFEAWKDESVVSALRESEEFKAFFTEMMAFSTAPMRMELFTELGEARDLFERYPPGTSKVHPPIAPGTQYL